MTFCELCCRECKNIAAHNKSKPHLKGITHTCHKCSKGFSGVKALQRHWKANTTGCTNKIFCKLCWENYVDIASHKRSQRHIRGVKFKCHDCGVGLSGLRALERHYEGTTCETPPTISQYRCCDCNLEFSTQEALGAHVKDETIHPPRAVKAVDISLFCEKCDREFKSSDGLKSHLASAKHNPLCEPFRCVGSGNGCKKTFQNPSNMISHLESGSCKSKINWEKMDQLMIENDTTGIIVEPDASTTRAACKEQILLALGLDDSSSVISSTDGGVGILTPASSEDLSRSNSMSSTDGLCPNLLLTPSDRSEDSDGEGSQVTITRRASIDTDDLAQFNFEPREGVLMHRYSTSDSSSQAFSPSPTGIMTPQSESDASGIFVLPERKYACPLCAKNKKKFMTKEGLQTHMASQAHASKIYHCPVSFLHGVDGVEVGEKKLKVKKFKTLSGLTAHIEVGACAGGKGAFRAVIEFVNEKLRGFGFGSMNLIEEAKEI